MLYTVDERGGGRRVSENLLVGALSPVNHKGLHQGSHLFGTIVTRPQKNGPNPDRQTDKRQRSRDKPSTSCVFRYHRGGQLAALAWPLSDDD